jgi:cytochrome c oxidase cbb3-type subunit 3
MPTKVEKDSVTGTLTTGHEWDGIKELNSPLPLWWLWVLYITIGVSAVMWILNPSWPWLTGYFGGLSGYSQRAAVDEAMAEAAAEQDNYLQRIAVADLGEIAQDGELLPFALSGGAAAFATNCAPCHGQGGAGRTGGFPSLADDAWIWGGTLGDIHQTLLYGIRFAAYDETRQSMMPPWRDVLSREQIDDVAEYVLAMSDREHDAEASARGQTVFLENCASCHGEDGGGVQELGGPALNDAIWLYGDSKAAIVAQITAPKHGVMPGWVDRLSPETIKMLSVYVHTLGGGQ